MKTIPLTQNRVAFVDDSDYDFLNQYRWCVKRKPYTCYAIRCAQISGSKQRIILMHRVILKASDGIEVDHITGDGLDNRRSNLRLCNRAENNRNQRLRSDNTTGFKGVTIGRASKNNPYHAYIKVNETRIHLGLYSTPKEAARAYDVAALKHYGEFALTNEMLGLLPRKLEYFYE